VATYFAGENHSGTFTSCSERVAMAVCATQYSIELCRAIGHSGRGTTSTMVSAGVEKKTEISGKFWGQVAFLLNLCSRVMFYVAAAKSEAS